MPETSIERGGWIAEHPLTGEKVHVVTREWFDELAAERDELREALHEIVDVLHAVKSGPRAVDEAEMLALAALATHQDRSE